MAIQKSQPTSETPGVSSSNDTPGMISDVKNLYLSKPDTGGQTTWTDEYPDDLFAAAENAESEKYALLIRNRKCYTGRKSLQIDSIIVQSPLLKASLGWVLEGYPGITTSLERLTFSPPFKPFVHRWKRLVQALEGESDPQAKTHLDLLYRVLELELRDDLKALDDYILNGVITFSTCWMLFEPGILIFGLRSGQPVVARLDSCNYVTTNCGEVLVMSCAMVDWDGEDFGYSNTLFKVGDFPGTASITKLSAFPLSYHPRLEKTKAELIERGRVFEALSGYHYKHYRGIATANGPWGPVKYNVDSRIIIDTYAWNRFNPNSQVSVSKLGMNKKMDTGDEADYSDTCEIDYESYDDLNSCDYDVNEDVYESSAKKSKPAPLDSTQLLTCCTSLKGYSLKNKKWLTFSISAVKDIRYNDGAFDSLVLPSDHKELILALTESQVKNKEVFDDVIQGKGKGMIMLLSGPPGVGKTLTAESVAESMHAPLYMMSAGDLGLDSSEVESSLSNVLEMATKWNAILLLDEADVFLEQRSSHDLERNKLVSIFLRILEYYEGVLFLTTNRVGNIDAAFQSRIHISMQYEQLSTTSRKHVWSSFLNASSKDNGHSFSANDLDELAKHEMNGREIKNVLKTAQLLASRKGEKLNVGNVESVLAIEQRCFGAPKYTGHW